ncbi:hypothetical protein MMC10_011295 [Thelotrema lepadinum]|nr:hypothetical protein [Thelotrema lepadinum]
MQENIPPSSPLNNELKLDSNRSPVKSESPLKARSPQKIALASPHRVSRTKRRDSDPFQENLAGNSDVTQADIHEDEDDRVSDASFATGHGFNPDDTCFSAFSAVPNTDMTAFARLSQSPHRTETMNTPPRHDRSITPGTAVPRRANVSPSKTPSRSQRRYEDEATTQLLEFTEQMNYTQTTMRTPTRGVPLSPSRLRSQPDLMAGAGQRWRSPQKDGHNLLDFDLPPAPTPRSVPSITARELESLKAGFLSEISSLKAKLSGQQAETQFLQEAKDQAERKVGDLSEELRDVKGAKQALAEEKADWEKRDKDMHDILREMKGELLQREKEQHELSESLEEREKRLEAAEGRVSEAESKLAGLQSQVSSSRDAPTGPQSPGGDNPATPGANSNAVEVAVERVARELHALYKTKHEQKVGALKKSYEARWERRVKELQTKVDDLGRENEELRVGRDVTMSGVVLPTASAPKASAEPPPSYKESTHLKEKEEQQAELKRIGDENEALQKESTDFRSKLEACERGIVKLESDNEQLAKNLEAARKGNSELVAAVDEMLFLESKAPPAPVPEEPPQQRPSSSSNASETSTRPNGLGGTGISSSKISGLRGPGFGGGYGESRIGTMKRSTSGNGTGARSGMMSSIERMGKGRVVE